MYFGPDYRGIQAVLITEFEGAQPVTATFNLNEKKGVAQLELGVPTPAHPLAEAHAFVAWTLHGRDPAAIPRRLAISAT